MKNNHKEDRWRREERKAEEEKKRWRRGWREGGKGGGCGKKVRGRVGKNVENK